MKKKEMEISNTEYRKKLGILFIMILVVMNVFLWTKDVSEEDNNSKVKYEMVMEEDESEEYMSIRFIKIDENIK